MDKVTIDKEELEQLQTEVERAREIREKQRAAAMKANEIYTHDKRVKAAMKAWKTRRRKIRLAKKANK